MAAVLLTALSSRAADIAWPDLSQLCFVKGRPANVEDVKRGCAVFVAEAQGQVIGHPLAIQTQPAANFF